MNRISVNGKAQRGEGKIGCLVAALVIGLVGAIGVKLVPVLSSNNELKDITKALATSASVRPLEELKKDVRAKALELKIPEAAEPGAIEFSKSGDHLQGVVTVRYNFSRKIDFYGVTTFDYVTQESVTYPYMDAR